jgi:hypothetical protein
MSRLLENADGRDGLPRRYRDIVAELVRHLGGNPTEPEIIIVRRVATMALWCEQQEQRMAAGDPIDMASFTTACNSLRRLLADLGLDRRLQDVSPLSLRDQLLAERETEHGGKAWSGIV